MHIDLAHSAKPHPLRLINVIRDASFYCLGLLYAGFSEWTLRILLDDNSVLAQALDKRDYLYEGATNLHFDLYIWITLIGLWAFFNSTRHAYFRLENAPISWLCILLIMSGVANYGAFFSETSENEIFLKIISLVWQESPMVKVCAFQSVMMNVLLRGLVLLVPLRTAFALCNKLLKRYRTV